MFSVTRLTMSSLIMAAVLLAVPGRAAAEPYHPHRDDVVLEQLPFRPNTATTQVLRNLRVQSARDPVNLAAATTLARAYMKQARLSADPRLLGYAQAALAPWWDQTRPPVDALVTRAMLRSSLHDFSAAQQDLDQALQRRPDHAQARLARAMLLQVRGDYPAARRDCLALLGLGAQLAGHACLSSVAALNGQARASYALLQRTLDNNRDVGPDDSQWLHGLLAEMAARLGDAANAERHYRLALQSAEPDVFLLTSYADFLLAQNRAREAVTLLAPHTRADGLLLRLALAEQRLRAPALREHIAALEARFAAARLRGESRHPREEALFLLRLRNKPAEALILAQQNWLQQREPIDASLVLEAAQAAGAPPAAQDVVDWLAETGLEDTHMAKLVTQLGKTPI